MFLDLEKPIPRFCHRSIEVPRKGVIFGWRKFGTFIIFSGFGTQFGFLWSFSNKSYQFVVIRGYSWLFVIIRD